MAYYIGDRDLEKHLLTFLMESSHQGMSLVSSSMEVLFINKAACHMLGLSADVIKENPSLEYIMRYLADRGVYGPGDPEMLVKEVLESAWNLKATDMEREQPDGRIIRMQRTPLGQSGFVTIYSDVTDQRTYEANLEATQYELEIKLEHSLDEVNYHRDLLVNAMDAINDGLIVFDENDHLVLANKRMQDLYPSLRRHLLHHSHIDRIEGFSLPDAPRPEDDAANLYFSSEHKLHDDNWYRINHSPTVNGGRIAIFSDVSVYKDQTIKLQDHTNQLVKLLQKEITLSETQREFVSMASHEFKTPLAIIDSNAQRIQRKIGQMPDDRLRERIGNIRDSVQRMQYLINRFMDFSTDEITGMKADPKRQPFRGALEKLCMSHREMGEDCNIVWDLDALPQFAQFDQNLLDQCVSNILSNAIKYSEPQAPIKVTGERTERYLKIRVEDQGVGIPKAEMSKIFKKYFRASTSSGIAGTGIGLNFAQMALKEHGGHIEVASEVGVGSCFTIFLPAKLAIDEQEEDTVPARAVS
nr:PAS-domain containing protein [uncultured Cohaesibacter sp.]